MKKIEKIKNGFKKFWVRQIEEVKKLSNDKLIKILLLCNTFVWFAAWQQQYGNAEDMPTFIITLLAFIAAGLAFRLQRKSLDAQIKSSKEQQIHNEKTLKNQDDALKIQQELGAWQTLGRKAPGNSGKIEAIQFLAKQGKALPEIDMSTETHGGQVYLRGLDVSEKTLGRKANLIRANFAGADLRRGLFDANFAGAFLFDANFAGAFLWDAIFIGADLQGADFKGAGLMNCNFIGADLQGADFKGADLRGVCFQKAHFSGSPLTEAEFEEFSHLPFLQKGTSFEEATSIEFAHFEGSYITVLGSMRMDLMSYLPKAPNGYKFDFIYNDDGTIKSEPELYKDGKPTGSTKHFICPIEINPE